ncbi:MAG: hypothetical protein M0P97_01545 [Candidatus Moranbacteria bacterium]|jgi:hypothetical protein|nr:hypothetical protein [Candidatus Moranbacteria bacterium]
MVEMSVESLIKLDARLREEQTQADKRREEILWSNFRYLEDGGIIKYLLISKYGKKDVATIIADGYLYEENGELFLTEKGEEYIVDMHLKNK